MDEAKRRKYVRAIRKEVLALFDLTDRISDVDHITQAFYRVATAVEEYREAEGAC